MENRTVTDKIVCSGALIYAKSTRRFLLLQKAHGKHIGTWGLVGGTNLQNENPWQGLQREIQEEIGHVPKFIKSIRPYLFSKCSNLISVNIPNLVTSIGNYAFVGCTSLSSIVIPNSVTYMGNGDFSDFTRLSSITIPDSVTSIGA
jgi:8-oxo-dGTP pyrophosphatase MutT (NUDIX family)